MAYGLWPTYLYSQGSYKPTSNWRRPLGDFCNFLSFIVLHHISPLCFLSYGIWVNYPTVCLRILVLIHIAQKDPELLRSSIFQWDCDQPPIRSIRVNSLQGRYLFQVPLIFRVGKSDSQSAKGAEIWDSAYGGRQRPYVANATNQLLVKRMDMGQKRQRFLRKVI